MAIIIALLAFPLLLYVVYKTFKDPLWGILIVLFLRPIEPLFNLESIQVGRIMGVVTFLIWFIYLVRTPSAVKRLRKSRFLKNATWLILALFMGTLSWTLSTGAAKAYDGFSTILLLVLLALMLENILTNEKRLDAILFVFAISGAMASLPAAAFMVGIDLFSVFGAEAPSVVNEELNLVRADALGGGTNSLGILGRIGILSSFLFLIHNQAKNKLILIPLAISFMGLVLSASRTNFYGILIASGIFLIIVLFFIRGYTKYIAPAAVIIFIGAWSLYALAPEGTRSRLLNVDNDDYSAERFDQRNDFRKNQQKDAVNLLFDYPLTGVGLYRTNVVLNQHYGAHDTISVIVGETGLFGIVASLILLTGFFFTVFRFFRKPYLPRSSKLLAAAIFSIFLSLIIMGFFGGLIFLFDRGFWVMVGISYAIINMHYQKYAPAASTPPNQLKPTT